MPNVINMDDRTSELKNGDCLIIKTQFETKKITHGHFMINDDGIYIKQYGANDKIQVYFFNLRHIISWSLVVSNGTRIVKDSVKVEVKYER